MGGVSANDALRAEVQKASQGKKVRTPLQLSYCTDNAAMIASAAYFLHREEPDQARLDFKTAASVPLREVVSSL